ncbi:MAG: hypothetical protein JKY89_04390 [Immundisolibacteraceae bacterium]|nr:hypothetical protein [Immundisolibacteraceae bacterium]
MNDQTAQSGSRSFSPYLPLFLLALALLTNFGFQTISLVNEAEQIKTAISNQEPAIEGGKKVRSQLAEIAKEALALANDGNKNATSLIEAMGKKGVNIKASEVDPEANAVGKIKRFRCAVFPHQGLSIRVQVCLVLQPRGSSGQRPV